MKKILVMIICLFLITGCRKEKAKYFSCSGTFEISTQTSVIIQKAEYSFTFDKKGEDLVEMSASITIDDSPIIWAAGEGKDGVTCNKKDKQIVCQYKIAELDGEMKNEVYRFLGEILTYEAIMDNMVSAGYICDE